MTSRIEVQYLSGESTVLPLSKESPLAIGRHSAADVTIDEEGVGKLHCRIQWNGKAFEALAGTNAGVEVNGEVFKKKKLKSEDVISIGSIDLAVQIDPADLKEPEDEPIMTAAIIEEGDDEEEIVTAAILEDDDDEDAATEAAAARPAADFLDGEDFLEEDDDDLFEEDDAPAAKTKGKSEEGAKSDGEGGAEDGEKKEPEPPRKATLAELLEKQQGSRKRLRPGEQESVRSPFVLGLIGGAALLLLSAVTLYFIIGRETAQRQFDAAFAEQDGGKYLQAIQLYDKFIQDYPQHKLTEPALFGRGHSRILNAIGGGAPNYEEGITQIEEFARAYREREAFVDEKPKLFDYSRDIALGAAKASEKNADAELLMYSQEGQKLMIRYGGKDLVTEELADEIAALQKAASQAITKRETREKHVAEIEAALSAKPPEPITALESRRDLIRAYPDLENSSQLRSLTDRIRETEQKLVTVDTDIREATTDPVPVAESPEVTLAQHNRSRSGQNQGDRRVLVVGKDACYGIDTITGEPVWRHVVGQNLPFFPLSVQSTVEGYLLFATRSRELMLLAAADGQLVWRQPIDGIPSGPPAIRQGQIYLPTSAKHLYKISLETGRISATMTFSQPLLSPPIFVADSDHMVVLGDDTLAYTVSTSPMKCLAVTEVGQQPGTVRVPMMRLEDLFVVAENDRTESAALRVFRIDPDTQRLVEEAQERVIGHVNDPMALRGTQLLVPSTGERVTGFTVSDAVGQKVLSRIGFVAKPEDEAKNVPMYLTLGPDGLFWMASTSIRKFRLESDTISVSEQQVSPGLFTQPLIPLGEKMFAGREVPYSDAVHFSLLDREEMAGFGRTIVGNEILAMTQSGDDVLALTESGHLFRVGADALQKRFIIDSDEQIELLPKKFEDQLEMQGEPAGDIQASTLADGRIVAWCGFPKPRVWVLNTKGEFDLQLGLKAPLETAPALLDGGLVLPLPGRLQIAKLDGGRERAQDFLPATDGAENFRWRELLRVDGEQLVTFDSTGRFRRLRFQTQNGDHLQEISHYDAPEPVDVRPGLTGGLLFVATGDGTLQMLDVLSWDVLRSVPLSAPAAGPVQISDDVVYVSQGNGQLMAFSPANLKPIWPEALSLGQAGLAAAPTLTETGLVVPTRWGYVLVVNPETGERLEQFDFGQPIVGKALPVADYTVVPLLDGTLKLLPR